ncbi:unnamed protein product, partial [marine sediment metagenome]
VNIDNADVDIEALVVEVEPESSLADVDFCTILGVTLALVLPPSFVICTKLGLLQYGQYF